VRLVGVDPSDADDFVPDAGLHISSKQFIGLHALGKLVWQSVGCAAGFWVARIVVSHDHDLQKLVIEDRAGDEGVFAVTHET